MNRLLTILLAACAGVLGFSAFHRAAEQTAAATTARDQEWTATTNRAAATQAGVTTLRGEVLDKRNRVKQATRHPDLSPALLAWLEGGASKAPPAAWTDLRRQLGFGWDSSPDYVLVSKGVLNQLSYQRLDSAARATDTACELLALSSGEQAVLRAALQRAQDAQWLRLDRAAPSGDVVAQYTIRPPDSAFEQSVSNAFAAEVVAALGPERSELLLPGAWREFRREQAPNGEGETITVRRSVVDGEPDLVWEVKRGRNVSTNPVRFAHYPSMWFLTLFPGGWKTLAEREGFELPRRFQNPPEEGR